MEALQKECLEEINNDHYHPYKNINRHVIEQLKAGNLPDKIDLIMSNEMIVTFFLFRRLYFRRWHCGLI